MMATAETRFDDFTIHTTSYKKVGDHEIAVSVLIPKNRQPGKHPLFVKFHGGGLVLGEALYPGWFAGWLIPFLLRNNAVAVLPNYRLIPEHTGQDIMDDIADFWTWFDGHLESYVTSVDPGAKLDFQRLCVGGDSAGGLLAFQSAIMAPEGKIKALLCEYPMTDYLKRSPQATLPDGQPFPPPEYIDKHVASIAPGTVISSSVPPQRMPLTFTLAAYGRWQDYYGTDKKLYPITAVEEVTHFPPTFIIHGKQDVAVSVEDSRKFVYKLGEVLGEKIKENIRLAIVDGDHGFDIDLVEEETGWLKDGLKWLEEKWLDG